MNPDQVWNLALAAIRQHVAEANARRHRKALSLDPGTFRPTEGGSDAPFAFVCSGSNQGKSVNFLVSLHDGQPVVERLSEV